MGNTNFTYTHIINRGVDKNRKCFIYKGCDFANGKLYIRTDDGRAYWIGVNEIEPIINKLK